MVFSETCEGSLQIWKFTDHKLGRATLTREDGGALIPRVVVSYAGTSNDAILAKATHLIRARLLGELKEESHAK